MGELTDLFDNYNYRDDLIKPEIDVTSDYYLFMADIGEVNLRNKTSIEKFDFANFVKMIEQIFKMIDRGFDDYDKKIIYKYISKLMDKNNGT